MYGKNNKADTVDSVIDEARQDYAFALRGCGEKVGHYINRIKTAHVREVAILKERLRIAHEALEKIVEMTAESETAIIAGNADNRLTCDDHAFKYLFYPKGENDAN